MVRFNLADYETVEERLKRFYTDHPDGRIITENETLPEYRAEKIWVVKSLVFFSGEDLERGCPKATGLAYEVDSASGPQQSSALEVCETSSIGRALANAGYSGNKRASREEMEKVQRFEEQAKNRDWVGEAVMLKDKDKLRLLWGEASKAGAPTEILEKVKAYAESITTDSEREGTITSLSRGSKGKRSDTE
tara:strand:+ start:1788 stop:2363 length:576 start_codon:yes stop_codon:yes gene_type:complete